MPPRRSTPPPRRGTSPASSRDAQAWAAPRSIFIPPDFVGGASSAATKAKPPSVVMKKKPAKKTTPKPTYAQAVNRREVSLGLPQRTALTKNVADVVPTPRPSISQQWEQQRDKGGRVGLDDVQGFLRDDSLPRWLVRGAKATAKWEADLARGDHDTQEATLDAVLGKGITNALQGQGPKSWQDIVGMTLAAATLGPTGKAARGAAAGIVEGGKLARAGKTTEEIRAGAKAASEAAYQGPGVISRAVGKIAGSSPKAPLAENITPVGKKKPNNWTVDDPRRIDHVNRLLWKQRPPATPSPFDGERKALIESLRKTHGAAHRNALPARMRGAQAMGVFRLIDHLANVGERGRFWYSKSAQAMLNLTGGDVAMARKLAALVAIYSPQQAVVQNIALAKNAMDEFVKTGTITIGDKHKIAKAMNVMEHGDTAWDGRKTANFYRNILKYLDPEGFQAEGFPGDEVTADMWMARLFGYRTDMVSDGRYDVIESVIRQIAKEKGWTPDEVQAATWVAMKDLDPWDVSPNVDFAGAIDQNTLTVNLETNKGISGIGDDLSLDETAALNRALVPTVVSIAERLGLKIRARDFAPAADDAVRGGRSAYESSRNASLHLDVFERPEAVQRLTNILARAFDQWEVWATKPGSVNSKAKPGLHFFAPELDDPEVASRFFAVLNERHPDKMAGFMPYRDGGGITVVSTGSKTNAELRAWAEEFSQSISEAADSAGIGRVNFRAQNIGVIVGKGDQNGGSELLGGAAGRGAGGRSLDDQLAAEGRAALERAVADVRAARGSGTRGRTRRAVGKLKSEEGSLGVGGGPATGDLEAILADLNPRTLSVNDATVQIGSARSRVSRALLERPADRLSRSRVARVLPTAHEEARVAKYLGRSLVQQSVRDQGRMSVFEKALPKKEGSPEDVAHFWWAQLPSKYRNVEGLQLVRDMQQSTLDSLMTGEWRANLERQLEATKKLLAASRLESSGPGGMTPGSVVHASDQDNWGRIVSVSGNKATVHFVAADGATADVTLSTSLLTPRDLVIAEARKVTGNTDDLSWNKLLARKGELELALDDIPYLKEELPVRIARLEKIIANPPEYDPDVVDAVHAFSRDRAATLTRAGALDPERAAAREGLVSSSLGLEPTGEEAYIGHRYGAVRGARPSLLPGGLGTGRPRLPQGVSRRNEFVLATTGRVRESTHVAVEDWRASRVFERAIQQRGDLGKMGVPFRPGMRVDPKTEILVNPKGRTIPQQWRNGDPLAQLAEGTDEEIRAAADELLRGYVSDPKLGQQSIDEVLAQAERDGVRWTELRVVKKATAERYAAQFRPAPRAGGKVGTAASAYDHTVDMVVASLIFARIGYIPKNVVQNLIMAVPHQGVFLVANGPRAGQVLKNPTLRHLFEAEVGFSGPTVGLAEESAAAKAFKAPHKIASGVGSVADNPLRFTALLHELAALGVIPKLKPFLSEADEAAIIEVFTNPRYRPIADTARNRAVESMADFSRLTPTQRKWSRRFLIIPGWLWAGSRYPIHFAATHPGRAAAGAYVAAGEPYGDRVGLPQNRPITDYMAEGLPEWMEGVQTPWGVMRTNSLSPVNTPIELAKAASQRDAQTLGDFANPLGASLWNVANRQVDAPTGSYKTDFLTALGAAGKRMAPNYGLVHDLVSPNADSKYYPGDASRGGRLAREVGILPIEVSRTSEKKKAKTKATRGGRRRTAPGRGGGRSSPPPRRG